jgi:hypothetical protein
VQGLEKPPVRGLLVDGTLHGRRDDAIAGAAVRIRDSAWRILSESISGDSGRFEVSTLSVPRDVKLEVATPGFRMRVVPLESQGQGGVQHLGTITMEPTTAVQILVLDKSKAPLGGVMIEARCLTTTSNNSSSHSPPSIGAKKANESGVASFEGLPPGSWEFNIRDPRYVCDEACKQYLGDMMQVSLTLWVRARDRVVVGLLDELNRAIVGATIRRQYDGVGADGDGEAGVTDSSGFVVLYSPLAGRKSSLDVTLKDGRSSGLADGPYYDGRRKWNVKTGIPESEILRNSVRGRVVDGRDAGLRAWVKAVSTGLTPGLSVLETSSDENGDFILSGLPQDRYQIVAIPESPSGTVLRLHGLAQVDIPSVPQDRVTIHLPVGEVISGVVLDSAGMPIAGLWIRADGTVQLDSGLSTAPSGPGILHTSCATDVKGRFVLDGLAEGVFLLTPSSGTSNGDQPWLEGGERVVSGTTEVALSAIASPLLRGAALTEDGFPLGNVRIVAVRLPNVDHSCEAKTTVDGLFVLGGRDPRASYRVSAVFEDGSSAPSVEVAPGECEVRLMSSPQVMVSGVLQTVAKAQVPKRALLLRHKGSDTTFEVTTDVHGMFRQVRVPAGEYEVFMTRASRPQDMAIATIHTNVEGQVVMLAEDGGTSTRTGRKQQ